VSAAAERGGLEVTLLNIVNHLDRSRFAPHVVFLTDGPFVKLVQGAGIETHVVDAGQVREVLKGGKAVHRLTRLIRQLGMDLVHTHNTKSHLYGGLAAACVGVPCLFHLHGVPRAAMSRAGVVDMSSMLVPTRATVACSEYVASAFRLAWPSQREVTVVHNGIELEPPLSQAEVDSVRAECGVPAGASLVLLVSRLQKWKGVHVLLDAVPIVLKRHPAAHFVIVGGTQFGLEKDYALALRGQAEQLQLNQAVYFAGPRSDVFRFYSAADLVVHSSIEPEPFGLVILEAMACGKPVVASDSGGPREIVENGITGLLVPANHPQELAEAIVNVLDNPQGAAQMGMAGLARVRSSFSVKKMVNQLQSIYEQMAWSGHS